MGRIIDLIKNFIEPKNQQTFDELAVESGISEIELKQLKSTMNGIDWDSFSREDEEKKLKKKSRTEKQVLNKNEVNIHKESIVEKNKSADIEIEK